ncbi:FliM/FliN family flagellar motor switch protein [Pararhodobacter sp.]|uniref:FliM/FliN family flagellar motor switch protein n=1 Tax=Pararhodobacter sp. TaxID=2127056 RepID=UPI002AFF7D31|nr:FliM/FliN family flagellar motor switch protein [Pararhodobacter sp.]
MTVQTRETTVLRRKLSPRTPAPKAASPVLTGPAQGIGRSFARAVSATAHLVAEQGKTQRQTVSQSELLDSIDTDAFVALLTAGDSGPALAILDQSGFSAIIEAMTIGRLGSRAAIPRRPTPTDASLLAEMLDKTLAGLESGTLAAMHLVQAVPDHRLLAVLLDDTQFDLVTHDVTLVSGDQSRPAQLVFAFPCVDAEETETASGTAPASADGSGWAEALEASVLRAPASLRAELGRITLPLSRVLELDVDSALTLPLSNLEEVQLVALDGSVHASGRLGQSRGMRAVRLTSWPNGTPPNPIMTEITPATAQKLAAPNDDIS